MKRLLAVLAVALLAGCTNDAPATEVAPPPEPTSTVTPVPTPTQDRPLDGPTEGTVIGTAGGTVTHAGAKVVIPAGALGAGVQITVASGVTPSAATLGAIPLGPGIVAGPEGQTFAKPVTIAVPYDLAKVPAGEDIADAQIFMAPNGSDVFTPLVTIADPVRQVLSAQTTHFTRFVPGLKPRGAPSITTSSPLPNATVGVAYAQSVGVTGGKPPYTWSVALGGALPAGLTLGASTGAITGTPSAAGTSSLAIHVSDARGRSVERELTLRVEPAPSPIPVLGQVSPAMATARSGATAIVVTGSGFIGSSVVTWDGAPLATSFADATHLGATIDAPLLVAAGTHKLTVRTPAPGGGTSAAMDFTITPPSSGAFSRGVTTTPFLPSCSLSGLNPAGTRSIAAAESDPDGGLILLGRKTDVDYNKDLDFGGGHVLRGVGLFIVKLDASCQWVWGQMLSGFTLIDWVAERWLVVGADGTIVFAMNGTGYIDGKPSVGNQHLVKLDASGKTLWARGIDSLDGRPAAVGLDVAGDVFWYGEHKGVFDLGDGPRGSATEFQHYVVKYTSSGALAWSKSFSGPQTSNAVCGVAVGPDGDLVLAGWGNGDLDLGAGPGQPGWSAYLVKLSGATGAYRWDKRIDASWCGHVAIMPNGNVVASHATKDVQGTPTMEIKVFSPDGKGMVVSKSYPRVDDGGLTIDGNGNIVAIALGYTRPLDATTVDFGGGARPVNMKDIVLFSLTSDGAYRDDKVLAAPPDDLVSSTMLRYCLPTVDASGAVWVAGPAHVAHYNETPNQRDDIFVFRY